MIDFNPIDWQTLPGEESTPTVESAGSSEPLAEAKVVTDQPRAKESIENICALLEKKQVDITAFYEDWVRIGGALAHTFGEEGREYFHRISRYNPNYKASETDYKYSSFLKCPSARPASLQGIYYLMKQTGLVQGSGFRVQGSRFKDAQRVQGTGTSAGAGGSAIGNYSSIETDISALLPQLPPLLRQVLTVEQNPDIQSLLFFGALVAFSAVVPQVYGIYDGKMVYPNLYGFVVAPPASAKGRLNDLIHLVEPIQQQIREENEAERMEYQEKMAQGTQQPLKEPPYRSLFIAANASSTAIYQALSDNRGQGLTFETEGDTIAQMFRSDYGNYSDGLRKAFHHEPISYLRRMQQERVEIRKPRWSVLLSGTPMQVNSFVPNAENGLFSRFLFYCLPRTLTWANVFSHSEQPLEQHFHELGERYLTVYNNLREEKPICFRLTAEQQARFNDFFCQMQDEYSELYGDELIASVRRLGLICFRISMVLSVLRLVDSTEVMPRGTMTCLDSDFDTALHWVELMLPHTAQVYSTLLEKPKTETKQENMSAAEQRLFNALPESFNWQDSLEIFKKIQLSKNSGKRYLGNFISVYHNLQRTGRGEYRKV